MSYGQQQVEIDQLQHYAAGIPTTHGRGTSRMMRNMPLS